ncbi:MAG: rod shape-determining protein MreD [Acidimicrobiales bacterium]
MNTARATVLGRAALIVMVTAVVQARLASNFSLLGVRPELALAVALAAGVAGGPERGAIAGFAVGLLYDVVLETPMGLSALVYALLAYSLGAMQVQMASHRRPGRMLFVGIGTAVGVVLWVVLGRLFDAVAPDPLDVMRVALVAGAINAVVGLGLSRLWAWVFAPEIPARVTT